MLAREEDPTNQHPQLRLVFNEDEWTARGAQLAAGADPGHAPRHMPLPLPLP